MNARRKQAQLRASYDASRFQLVTTELDLAATFCQIAGDAHDQVRCDRNIANAEKAYAAADYFLAGNLTASQTLLVQEKVAHLDVLLEGLHARVWPS